MHRVRLIHWNAAEAKERAARLRAAGYRVTYEAITSDTLRTMRNDRPVAVVIDLARLPSQGRDVALALRQSTTTRHVPLVFVDGDPEKVARVKQHLPDAVYTTWGRIRSSLKRAIAHPAADPVVPSSSLAGYAGTPLPQKLGIKAHSVIVLVGAPQDFEETLGKLPEGVALRRRASRRRDLTIWFTKSRRDLERRVERMGAAAGKDGLWIAWPKKASGVPTDVTQVEIRRAGLAVGLVDYKICAIDTTWTGLKFARRKSK